jgi:5,10-methylenetetrahydrofolate reductase
MSSAHGEFPVPVLIGVLPLQGHKHATFLHNEVPGITLTEDALERMRLAGANGRQEGVKMAQELLLELKELALRAGRLSHAELWPL